MLFILYCMAISITAADQQNGGGIVVTVAGSSGGSVSCYYQTADQTSWTLLGSRTGNGTISGTLTSGKTYYLYGLDGTTLSAVISSVVTAAEDAVMERVLAAVKSELQAVATAGGFHGTGTIFPALTSANIVKGRTVRSTTIEAIIRRLWYVLDRTNRLAQTR